jgi:hypothetical protein
MRSRPLIVCVAYIMVLLGVAVRLDAQAAAPFKIDQAAAQWGEHQWKSRQCTGCHDLGRRQSTGPDLLGVTERRSVEWLRQWLKNPVAMTQSDSVAGALKKEYGSVMPNLDLSDRDVEGLINYLAVLTQERRAGK